MQKTTHYLWRSDFSTESEYENTKTDLTQKGFRVATFSERPDNQQISPAFQMLLQNHFPGGACQIQASETHTFSSGASL